MTRCWCALIYQGTLMPPVEGHAAKKDISMLA